MSCCSSNPKDLGDCPICLLPFPNITPTDEGDVIYIVYDCCSKLVCDGCVQANSRREVEASLLPSCPFCRHHPLPTTEAEGYLLKMKRAEMNDPVALHDVGVDHSKSGDIATAIKYFKKAAELGHAESHYQLSVFYIEGRGLEKDMKKFVYHLEQAAIGGHSVARHNLGAWEGRKGNDGRAVKHYTIAANLGFDVSLEALKKYYARGMVSREDFAAVIRQHQAALDATKSPQRHEAKMNRKVHGECFQ